MTLPKRSIIWLCIIHITCSCELNRVELCKQKADYLIDNLDETKINRLFGVSAEVRGEDENGETIVSRISYTDQNRNVYEFPSFQEPKNKSKGREIYLMTRDSMFDYDELAKILNIDAGDPKEAIKVFCGSLESLFHEFGLYKISSQRYLGDFIEFKFDQGCSLWYKSENTSLKEAHSFKFNNALRIKGNWYIWRESNMQQMIMSFE